MPNPVPEKREAMKAKLEAGYCFDVIARELGYKDARSAWTMAHRWGLHTLHPRSYWFRATGEFKISDPYKPNRSAGE